MINGLGPISEGKRADLMKNQSRINKLVQASKLGNEQAKEEIIMANKGLVFNLAHKLSNDIYDSEELFQVGVIGMLKAINKYNPERKAKFSTFATHYILGEIKMFLRDNSSIKLGRKIKQDFLNIKEAKHNLSNRLKREPTVGEIANELDLKKEQVIEATEVTKQPLSISSSNKKEGVRIIDKLGKKDVQLEAKVDSLVINQIINKLKQREKMILRMRYVEEKSQQEIGKQLNISQAHVSRLEKTIINKIKKEFIFNAEN